MTGELFAQQTADGLLAVLERFDPTAYDPEACRRQAERFQAQNFRAKLMAYVTQIMGESGTCQEAWSFLAGGDHPAREDADGTA